MAEYAGPWRLNSLAGHAVVFLMSRRNMVDRFVTETRSCLENERRRLTGALAGAETVRVYPSVVSVVLFRLTGETRSTQICESMAREGILIRDCANFQGLSDRRVRISLKGEGGDSAGGGAAGANQMSERSCRNDTLAFLYAIDA